MKNSHSKLHNIFENFKMKRLNQNKEFKMEKSQVDKLIVKDKKDISLVIKKKIIDKRQSNNFVKRII